MSAGGTGSRGPDGRGGGLSSRRWMYGIAAIWLLLATLSVTQWLTADDSGGRWRAAVQFSLAVALALGYAAQARRNGGRERGR